MHLWKKTRVPSGGDILPKENTNARGKNMHESERQYCKNFPIIAGFDTAWPVHGSLWKLVREAVVHSSRSAR
jgi:hypothetical protein